MGGNLGVFYYRQEHGYGKGIEKLSLQAMPEHFEFKGSKSFCLKTTYPGLLVGTGYAHPVSAKVSDEAPDSTPQNGFYFDYTTGLPTIPGSSIKGVLRSVFPSLHVTDKKEIFGEKAYKEERAQYIIECVKNLTQKELTKDEVIALELELFEGIIDVTQGTVLSSYKRDIFYDAFIVEPKAGKYLASDYITPHKNRKNLEFEAGDKVPDEFCEPTPIQIIKVAPDVSFAFQFRLHDGSILSANQKLELFKQIILELGLGAKTNVGYGQFVEA